MMPGVDRSLRPQNGVEPGPLGDGDRVGRVPLGPLLPVLHGGGHLGRNILPEGAPEGDRHEPALAQEVAVNFSSPIRLVVALLPHLLEKPAAMVVNVTSGLALAPKQSSPVYCATKAGLRSFTKALRYQAQARAPHVRIVEALPPLVDTDMTRGRGRGKMRPEACAAEIVVGMEAGRNTIYVGKAKLLRAIQGLSPFLADRLMRYG